MDSSLDFSRNVIKTVLSEYTRQRLPELGTWVTEHQKDLARTIGVSPDELDLISVTYIDPYTPLVFCDVEDKYAQDGAHSFEIIVRSKRTDAQPKYGMALDSYATARQAMLRSVLYAFLEGCVAEVPTYFSEQDRHLGERLRLPPEVFQQLGSIPIDVTPNTRPILFTWSDLTTSIIVRAKRH